MGSLLLNGGTISSSTITAAAGTLNFAANGNNLLSAVTVNGDLNFNVTAAATRIASGTTFTSAHLAANVSSLGFFPGQTLSGTILFEGAVGGNRIVEMNGAAGAFTVGTGGIIRTETGLGGNGIVGGAQNFGGTMTLANAGLISSQVSGKTITISAASFTNSGTVEATNGGAISVPLGYTQTAGTTRVNAGTISTSGLPLATINIQGGLLEGSGTVSANVTDAAILSPGLSAGTLTISGDLTVTTTTQFTLEIGGVNQGADYDFLSEGGTVALNLNGTLSVSLINGFVPTSAALFTVVGSNQNLTGAFLNVASGARLFSSSGGGSFQVNYGPGSPFAQTAVVLSNFAVPEPSVVGLLLPAAIALFGARKQKRVIREMGTYANSPVI